MAIFSNLNELSSGTHAIWESSLVKSTITGHINDVLVVSETTNNGVTTRTPIDCDNGTAVRIKEFTHSGNGLQERYAVIAGVKDKVAILGTPALIKDNRTEYEGNEAFFYNKAGVDAKAYEIIGDEFGDGDIFGVTKEGFTTASQSLIAVDNYVVLDGNGKYVALAAAPTMSNYGFVGQIHSLYTNNFYTLVRIYVLQNVDNN
jgi:hypothetical protein